jgi:4-amino-4-deoxy-L-arabinose transferase-like glycosyltransferase
MWFPYAAPFYVARIAEMRPALIILAAVTTIGILIWKKPRGWVYWIAGVVIGAIVLILMSDRRDRR